MHELAARLRQQHGQALRVNYATKKGFYLLLGGGGRGGRPKHPCELEEEPEESGPAPTASVATQREQQQQGGRGRGGGGGGVRVPPGFIVLQHSGRTAQVTTPELNALNARLRDAAADCLTLTEQARWGRGRLLFVSAASDGTLAGARLLQTACPLLLLLLCV